MPTKTNREHNFIFNMRRNRQLLQRQVATLIGRKYTRMLSKYELGVSLPPLQTALILEIVLGIRLPELYPDLHKRLEELVLERSRDLPEETQRALRRRILRKDDDEHT